MDRCEVTILTGDCLQQSSRQLGTRNNNSSGKVFSKAAKIASQPIN